MTSDEDPQLATSVLMVRPASFGSNPLTAASNYFQKDGGIAQDELQARALFEFDGLRSELEASGIEVVCVEDKPRPPTPDAVFPNNWISFHADGTVVLYPMEAENRRTERRIDIVHRLERELGFEVAGIVDLSGHELSGRFLEGTGSVVLDRRNRVAFACRSSRTDPDVLAEFEARMGYESMTFDAFDARGQPIYHTNVMMSIGEDFAVVCTESITDTEQRQRVISRLEASELEIIPIDFSQLDAFAGNVLQLASRTGETIVAMSATARHAFTAGQLARMERRARIVSAPVDTIESYAGGSVRCMLAEIHLHRRVSDSVS